MSAPVTTRAPRSAASIEIYALAGRRLQHLRAAPGRLLGIAMNSLVTMVAVGYLFGESIVVPGSVNYQEYLMAGAAAQIGLASIAPTAIGVAMDLKDGLTDRFRSLPISRGAVLIGHTIGDFVVGLLALVAVCTVGYISGWRTHTGILSTVAGFALMAAFIYAMLWLGVLLGLAVRNLESIDSIGGIVVVAFSFVSNAFLSTEKLPDWIQPLAEWNPVSSVSNACRVLWGNPIAADSGIPVTNPGLVVTVSLTLLLVVTVPLSFRRYRAIAAV